jgi:formate dehydrogenase subunit gamma
MNTTVERLDAHSGFGRTVVHRDELLRHGVYTRLVHWGMAAFFVLALLSGFAIYSPWLFLWLTPLFGGGAMTRLLHPWFSLGFVVCFALQMFNWWREMAWSAADSRWMSNLKHYVANRDPLEPDDVGFFNGGQKIYFWAIAGSAVLFVISGIPMWFPETFGRPAVDIGYVLHDMAALLMLVSFIVHVYEGTAAQPGTLESMTRGTVERRWAWTHHPAWYRSATGRDPRGDYQAAINRQSDSHQHDRTRETG